MDAQQFEDEFLKQMETKRAAGASLEQVVIHALLTSRVSNEPDAAFARAIIRLLNPQPCEHTMELQSLNHTIKILANHNDKMKLALDGVACEKCFSASWAPCEPSAPGAVNMGELGWAVCQLCQCEEQLRAARANTPQAFGAEGRVN